MIRLYIAAGLIIGAAVWLGQQSSQQLHLLGSNALAWGLLHWAVLLPWALAGLFCWLWRRASRALQGLRGAADHWETFGRAQIAFSERDRKARLDTEAQAAQRAAQKRKRALR